MQLTLDLGAADDLDWVRAQLEPVPLPGGPAGRETPVGQLVKSMIGNRTRDGVSLAAYRRLVASFPGWDGIASAAPDRIEAVIRDVTFADVKARRLVATLNLIRRDREDFDLSFLARLGTARALDWLEHLPGVGRKVSASTLAFSTLGMRAMVVDTHVLRVLGRVGILRPGTTARIASDAVMARRPDWDAADLEGFHARLKLLGQILCRADALHCTACPLRRRCRASAARPGALPVPQSARIAA